mmetsp:Transcript_97217/g.245271  ORF Transcript_97217/g.245271 Transcript_97217/m.245271 type:complete len:196 (-) Transcript_97217:57-644(-)
MAPRFIILMLALVAEGWAKSKKMAGSQKCERGMFVSEAKDAVIPLCDEHFPNEKAKNPWLVYFYRTAEDEGDVHDSLNRIAQDLGNEPPQKSKSQIKVKKQRVRLKDLGEKYEFEVALPRKGPPGSDPILKVGGVCCDCGSPQNVCEGHSGFVVVKTGGSEVPLAEAKVSDPGEIVRLALQEMGFVKATSKGEDL